MDFDYDELLTLLDRWIADLPAEKRHHYLRLRERLRQRRDGEQAEYWRGQKSRPHDLQVYLRRQSRRHPQRREAHDAMWEAAQVGRYEEHVEDHRLRDRPLRSDDWAYEVDPEYRRAVDEGLGEES